MGLIGLFKYATLSVKFMAYNRQKPDAPAIFCQYLFLDIRHGGV